MPQASGRIAPLLFTLFMVCVACASWTSLYGFRAQDGSPALRTVYLEGDHGDLERLQAVGFTISPMFRVWTRVTGFEARKGTHILAGNLTPWDLSARVSGKGKSVRVTFPEGFHRFDMGRRLEALGITAKAAFVEASGDPALLRELDIRGDSAEGFLFPSTYEFPLDSDAQEIVRRQKQEFDRRYRTLAETFAAGRDELRATLHWETSEVVTAASVVEKEAAVDSDRPLIASVLVNRLRDPAFPRRVLQCDPTAGYGCIRAQEGVGEMPTGCAQYRGKITREVNQDPSNRYSGYTHEGLPPGPIANPGAASLKAVLDAQATRFLYFYAKPGSLKHTFSETYEAHQAAIHGL